MADTPIYFGRPGHLQELPYPRGGADISRARTRASFTLGSGGVRMSQLPGGKRRFAYAWQSLDLATYAVIQAFDQGHEGVGPFALLDPSQVNMLTDNQSAATSVRNDADNFTIAGSGCTLASDSTTYDRGPASLRWDFAVAAPAGATLTLDSPSPDWPGIPVVADRTLCFSFTAKGGGSDAVVTLTPQLRWLDSAGATLSTSSGTAEATSSSGWEQMYVAAAAPANAVYVLPLVAAAAASVSVGARVNLDRFQLEASAAPTTWRPGTGVLPVQVVSLPEAWPWGWPGYRSGAALTLQEVGP